MTEQRLLVDRVRPLISAGEVREVKMFGAIALMVDDAMALAVNADGSLLVRVAPSEDEALLRQPDASRAEMGRGRDMGIGWLRVIVDSAPGEDRLQYWVDAALRRRASGGDPHDPRTL
ncbi:TfoX/Sxy family protein [Microbacterium sp. HD4P20]|uniref:TfoX/Sxy family protein n=1 Tax=Microbacterium sp. HD4P20 TaxID=2864874 RepID=UPI0020A5B945|nr:TfoX/Sxy family protein [Microbacterium sp. HD4P20]MCP2635260.1 TfoX/Sxy family protein [Microbacterium sp. HD4P20]